MKSLAIFCMSLVMVCVQSSPQRCPLILKQVCGSDGVTYDNECMAGVAKVEVVSDTPCPTLYERSGDMSPCNKKYLPVCASDRVTGFNNPCVARNAGVYDFTNGACPQPEQYDGKRTRCTMQYTPVCGNNGKTYDNSCEAIAASQPYTDGACVMHTNSKRGVPIPCPAIYKPVCGTVRRTFANDCNARASGVTSSISGMCPIPELYDDKRTTHCTMESNPVCGSNGKTYNNPCAAIADSQPFESGPCVMHTNSKRGGHIPCHANYEPVCGTLRQTFDNECNAKASGASSITSGEC